MRQYGEYRVNRPRGHIGRLQHNYAFNEDTILNELRAQSNEEKDLGTAMNSRWAELGRRADVRSITGAKTINMTQVLVQTSNCYRMVKNARN